MGRNGQLIIRVEEIFGADSFKRFLKTILNQAKTKKKILLVLDNAKYHHAKRLREYIDSIKDCLEFFYLPAYSPEINAIEMLW